MTTSSFTTDLAARVAGIHERADLVTFLSWLDATDDGAAEPWESPRTIWIARAFAACAQPVLGMHGSAAHSIEAALAFVREPSEETYDACFHAGTDAFPFGFVLDGCLSMSESGVPGCDPGSGCRSGAGVLLVLADVEGSSTEAVVATLRSLGP